MEQCVEIDGIMLRIFDTAGIRNKTDDVIESMGIDIAKQKLASDDTELVLALFDTSRPFDDNDAMLIDSVKEVGEGHTVIPVFTKKDLPCVFDTDKVESVFGKAYRISSATGEGIEELKKAVIESFVTCESEVSSGAVLTNIRQLTSLKKCADSLEEAQRLINIGMKDMALLQIEQAVNTVGEIDSRVVAQRIVDEIFSKFCVGK